MLAASTALLAGLTAVLGGTPAVAGGIGAGETQVSLPTVATGTVAVTRGGASPESYLTVWEQSRTVTTGTQQGVKREILGQYLDAKTGAGIGSPVLLVSLGGTDDATRDAVDPSLTRTAGAATILTYTADELTNTDPSGRPVDTTAYEIRVARVINTANVPALSGDRAVTDVAGLDPAYDQQHPDIARMGSGYRVVWDGDAPAGGDGKTDLWTLRLDASLVPVGTATLVSNRHASGAEFDNAHPRLAGPTSPATSTAGIVVWEGVDTLDTSVSPNAPVRRTWAATVDAATAGAPYLLGSTTTTSATEELSPDIVFANATNREYVAVWASEGRLYNRRLSFAGGPAAGTTTLTDGTVRATQPSITIDNGQEVVAWTGRGPTTGPGHHEVYAGRWDYDGTPTPQMTETNRISTVDDNVSGDNAQPVRPAVATSPTAGTTYAAWSREKLDGTLGVAGRVLAPRVDLSVSATASPTDPSNARSGNLGGRLVTLDNGDTVTLTVDYALKASSPNPVRNPRITIPMTTLFMEAANLRVLSSTGIAPTYAGSGAGVFRVQVNGTLNPGEGGRFTIGGLAVGVPVGTPSSYDVTIGSTLAADEATPLDNTSTFTLNANNRPLAGGVQQWDPNPTSLANPTYRVYFDETVSGVDAADFDVTSTYPDAVVSSVGCSTGTSCLVRVSTGGGNGTVGLRLRADATIVDTAGKSIATASLPLAGPDYTVDHSSPHVTVTSSAADPTRTSPIPFALTFDEPVTGLTFDELDVTNGTVSSLTGSGATRAVTVTPTGDGPVGLSVPTGVATDTAGNTSIAGSAISRTYDSTRPVLTLDAPAGPHRAPYDVTVTAAETVTGFDLDDVSVTGGSVGNLTGTGPWTVTVTPDTEGPVVLTVRDDAVADAAGNTSVARSLTRTYDVTRPSVTVSSAAANPTGASPVPFTLTFDEPVTGLTVGDLTVTGGTAQLSGSGTTWTALVTPTTDGPVSVAVRSGAATDTAGNTSTAGTAVTRTYDSTGPGTTLTSTATNPTNDRTIAVSVSFTEAVADLTLADLQVTNGTASNLTGSGTNWTLTLTADDTADTVAITLPAGVVHDAQGNPNPGATPLSRRIDTTRPGGTLTSTTTGVTNATTVPVTLTFDEPVTGLTLSDLTTVNATATNLTGSGTDWSLTLTPTTDGTFSVALPAGAATDTAGNTTTAVPALTRTHDRTGPTASLTVGGPTMGSGPVDLTLTTSEDAVIDAADIATTNADVTSVTGGPRRFVVRVTPTSDGPFTIQLRADRFTDPAGNGNSASGTVSLTQDGTSPSVVLGAPALATDAFPVTLEFSESVTGLALDDLRVTNGTASRLTGSGGSYAVTVTPASDGPVAVALAGSSAFDAAGNPNPASAATRTSYDGTRPGVALSSPAPAATGASPIPVAVDFTEPVIGFALEDLVVGNGTATNLAGSGDHFTVDVVPAGEGPVTVDVAASAATDGHGNLSTAAVTLTREFDSIRPTVVLTSSVASPTNAVTVPVTVAFSKAVNGFTADDLRTTGGTVSGFSKVDGRTWTFSFTPTSDGAFSVVVPENAAASAADLLSLGGSYENISDRTAPVLTATGPAGATYDGPVEITLASSEALPDLAADDLVLSGTARPATVELTSVDARHWTARVSGMSADGTVTLTVPDDAAHDVAGNATSATHATSTWRRQARFGLVQAPVRRSKSTVRIPTTVVGPGPVRFTYSSSNRRVLRPSGVEVTGSGRQRMLQLAGTPGRAGASRVVVTARFANGTAKRIVLRFVTGSRGGDRLVGTSGIDVMLAGVGNDVLIGKGGADILCAGYGNDVVRGGAGDDVIVGSYGRDVLYGQKGRDLFIAFPQDRMPDVDRARDRLVKLPARMLRLYRE
jgi:hypothetical protein